MTGTLHAGAARRIVNPPLGMKRVGARLFNDPIEAIESDLSATALVLSNDSTKLVIIGLDACLISLTDSLELRQRIGEVVGTTASHVMINFSHTHSAPVFPGFGPDAPEERPARQAYWERIFDWLVQAAIEADELRVPARIGADFGEARVGIYRRELKPDGTVALGEDPNVPIDHSVGVIRVDDLEGGVIAVLFSYGCHPVTIGPRHSVASSDFPGPARELVEESLGGLSIFLQGCGGNINPVHGIGLEEDCRDTKNRTGLSLGSEVVRVAADIRTHVRRSAERMPLGSIPNIFFWAWEPVEGEALARLAAADEIISLEFMDLPSLDEAEEIHREWKKKLDDTRLDEAEAWEVNMARFFTLWSMNLLKAVKEGNPPLQTPLQALRINDIVIAGVGVEAFTETGMAVKADSPCGHTQVLGYTNGLVCYLPCAKDYPAEGWKITERYPVPDLFFQSYGLPVALRPESEQAVVEATGRLIRKVWKEG
jgi:neutral ceramidase